MSEDGKDGGTTTDATVSLTGSRLSSMVQLLGSNELPSKTEPKALLRIQKGQISEPFMEALQIKGFAPFRLPDGTLVPVVLGPFDLELIKNWAMSGFLHRNDQILTSYNRWKSPKVVFPALVRNFSGVEEVTETATVEKTGSLSPDFFSLEVEPLDELHPPTTEAEIVPPSPGVGTGMAPRFEVPPIAPPQPKEPRETTQVVRTADLAENFRIPAPTLPQPRNSINALLLIALVCCAGLVTFLLRRREASAPATTGQAKVEAPHRTAEDWPEDLRPLPTDALEVNRNPLIQKLRPILRAYERGATVLTSEDELILRTMADPASASWDARRLAANQLAVFYLAKLKFQDARRTLQPIVDASPDDPITLLNEALLKITEGDFAQAKEAASVAVRLSPPGMLWVAYSVLGIIQGRDGHFDEADKQFENALSRSSNNPFIYGMWIQALSGADPSRKARIPALIREALWADPDRLTDSPIRAPLGGQILIAEALTGLKKGADWPANPLGKGLSAFIHWLDARRSANPLGESVESVREALAGEVDPQSQLLYAYLLKEQGKIDQASAILTRLVPLLSGQKMGSSWPWTFAGDLQSSRNQMDQALIFYQAALSRNSQDTAAVHGLALVLRERGDYAAAEQKLAESLSLDPLFIPALLRIDRFEWQRRVRTE